MIYADTGFFLALAKDADWLETRARAYEAEFEGQLVTSMTTFVELFLLAERYDLDRTRLAADALELVELEGEEDVVFQADELIDQGFTVFDAFHGAWALLSGHELLSSDKRFDDLPVDRHPLEQDEG